MFLLEIWHSEDRVGSKKIQNLKDYVIDNYEYEDKEMIHFVRDNSPIYVMREGKEIGVIKEIKYIEIYLSPEKV